MKKKLFAEKGTIWFLCLIAGMVSVPLMTDYVMTGSSLQASLNQIEAVGRELGKVFPVRFSPLGTLDYGYGAASLQADLFYLFPAALYLAGMNVLNAYKWTILLFNIVTAAVAYGCFRGICSRREIGLLCSALYTWCPYRCSEVYLAGDLGETAAWTFLPLVMLGLSLLSMDEEQRNGKKPDTFLVWGISLVFVSSTVVAFAAFIMMLVFLLAMGKRTWTKSCLRVLCRTFGTVILVNAWLLIPMMSWLRDNAAVGTLLLRDVRSRGMYLPQYFHIFSWGQDGVELVQNGLAGAQSMGPGIAVILLILSALWYLNSRDSDDLLQSARERKLPGRVVWVSVCLMALSSNLFPWDLLQNKNWLCSVILALMNTPAKLGIAADLCLITAAGLLLSILSKNMEHKYYMGILWAAAAISFLTTQFMLGQIMVSRQFIRLADWEAMERLPFSVLEQESALWRLSELISVIALVVCAVLGGMRAMRRRNVVERAKKN